MSIKLKQAHLRSGEVVEIADGLTVIVGPNNVGKTLLLNELYQELLRHPGQDQGMHMRVIDHINLDKLGSVEEFIEWLANNYYRREPGAYPDGRYTEPNYRSMIGVTVTDSQVQGVWNLPDRMGALGNLLVRHLGADGRTQMANDGSAFNLLTEKPSSPMQFLYADRLLEQKASELMMRAFHMPLTINRYAGNAITLHVGRPRLQEDMPPSTEYLEELFALPHLQNQGDGVRAFMGILLMFTTSQFYPLILIDEPEAFLHPPQAYLLGRVLAEQHDKGAQVIVATHSTDILRGITSVKAATDDVTVVRLTRSDAGNHVAQVPAETVGDLYEDPLIKYYGILDGLFYQGVVLCEGDSDCTYYRAVLDSIGSLVGGTSTESVSIHFAHCGGKARLAKGVETLRSAKVPVVCVVDFDFFRDGKEFNELVASSGGDPEALSSRRNDVLSAIQAKATVIERVTIKAKIDDVLNGRTAPNLSGAETTKIKAAVSSQSGWQDAKKQGRGLLSGQAVESFDILNAELRKLGIFVVADGELERFHPEVSAQNKAEWLRRVLEQKKYLHAENAHKLITDVASNILGRQA
ncbi:MAG: AAA family ATPase [Pseudonocardiaceae bacterium]